MNSINFVLLVLIICQWVNGQYFSAHEGSVLSRNGKRSYLFDLIRSPSLNNKNGVLSGSDGYYLADKLSVRNKFKKFGRRDDMDFLKHSIDNLSDEMLTKIASSHSNESSEEENLK